MKRALALLVVSALLALPARAQSGIGPPGFKKPLERPPVLVQITPGVWVRVG